MVQGWLADEAARGESERSRLIRQENSDIASHPFPQNPRKRKGTIKVSAYQEKLQGWL
jgi:hypothetical protein